MSQPFAARAGAVLSADIAVPEHERELRFYSRVLSTGETPLWRDDLMNNLGIPIIGLGALTPELETLPLQWMPHIQVADVAATVQRAAGAGGQVLMHSQDAEGRSQWAVLADPNGAAFGVIPIVDAGAAAPPENAGEEIPVGRILWLDLTVPDAPATREFYRTVIGWTPQDVAMKDGDDDYADYNMLDAEGTPAAGVCHARGVNAGLPPVWMLYLPVADLAESLRRVEQEGGKVLRAVRARDGTPRYAAIQDPVGVAFALVPG